jgi:hypothetical protein
MQRRAPSYGLVEDFHRALDPAHFSAQVGLPPDDWQAQLLRSTSKRILLNCSRQSGKTTTIATAEAQAAIYLDGIQIVNVAPGIRQSRELFRKVALAYRLAGRPIGAMVDNKLELELRNGSRVIALPGKEGTIRGFSGIDWLIFEEAARIPDELYYSVRPMIATRPNARIIIPSTPFGERGFFYEEWRRTVEAKMNRAFGDLIGETSLKQWEYIEVKATDCPRITADFLEDEQRSMGEFWYNQEYMCQFMPSQSQAFSRAIIDQFFSQPVEEWTL